MGDAAGATTVADRDAGHPRAVVRTLVVDDHPLCREALSEVVAATPGFQVVGEAASGEAALELLERDGADLVLLDVRMPGLDGTATAAFVSDEHPETVVMLVSAEGRAVPADDASPGGIRAFRKECVTSVLLRSVMAPSRV